MATWKLRFESLAVRKDGNPALSDSVHITTRTDPESVQATVCRSICAPDVTFKSSSEGRSEAATVLLPDMLHTLQQGSSSSSARKSTNVQHFFTSRLTRQPDGRQQVPAREPKQGVPKLRGNPPLQEPMRTLCYPTMYRASCALSASCCCRGSQIALTRTSPGRSNPPG